MVVAEFVYEGIAYKQALDPDTAPWIMTFVAPAEDITAWAGVPRRSSDRLAGFQRAVDEPRRERAEEFFTQPPNQSPTAVIVGIHQSYADDAGASFEWLGPEEDGRRSCRLTLTV